MKIVVIDDYQDAFRTLRCFGKLEGHEVLVYQRYRKGSGSSSPSA